MVDNLRKVLAVIQAAEVATAATTISAKTAATSTVIPFRR